MAFVLLGSDVVKKLFSLLLVSITLMLCVLNCYADTVEKNTVVTVAVPDRNNAVDGKYLVDVVIEGNEGFSSLQLELAYDADVFKCSKVVSGTVVKGMLSDFNPKADGELTCAIFSVAGIDNTVADGTLCTFVFEKITEGNPKIEVLLMELISSDGKQLNCDTVIDNRYVENEDFDDNQGGEDIDEPVEDDSSDAPPNDVEIIIPNHGPPEDIIPPVVSPPDMGEGEYFIHGNEVLKPKIEDCFTDVTSSHWAYDYIVEAKNRKLIEGYSDSSFRPDLEMTRAEFVTLIWNMNGKTDCRIELPFEDVDENAWYYPQICWAYEKGYVSGVSENQFSPSGMITRQQVAAILYRMCNNPNVIDCVEIFEDSSEIEPYAKNALNWAVEKEIFNGVDETHLAPNANATRAQLCAIVLRYVNIINQ